jgi:hypothetical protein
MSSALIPVCLRRYDLSTFRWTNMGPLIQVGASEADNGKRADAIAL